MAVTKMNDVINPQVMGDMISAKIEALLNLTLYAKVDTSLQGVPGDTKTVPSWNYIGDAEDFNPESDNGDEIETSKLTAGSTTFTIKCIGKSVAISQTAINSGLGNPVGQAEKQLALSIAGKVDSDVLAAAYISANTVNKSSAAIGYDAIVDCVTKFEDEEDGIEKVMFIHPKQEATLLKDSDFLSADKFTAGVAVNGAIGKIAGCWIKKSKKVRTVDAVTAVPGVYNIKIDTKASEGDKIAVNGVEITAGGDNWSLSTDTATGNATVLATALNASTDADVSCYTWSNSGTNLIATEDVGGVGGVPTVVATQVASGTLAVTTTTTTAGVEAVAACYECPIIKMEPDSAETEYTEDELPAIKIFLKKDTQVDHEWFPKKQRHDVTAAKYYGVALTNGAKVVVGKFGK